MPTVYIWHPDSEHRYGHAALQTDKYHISFWPDGDVKEDLGVVKTALVGVDASLIFHQELDRHYQGNRLPARTFSVFVMVKAINRMYEEFLRYNGIDPADVTLEAAEEVIANGGRPEVSVSRTKFSFMPDIMFDAVRPSSSPFYHFKQSCVSFCFNLINKADSENFIKSEVITPLNNLINNLDPVNLIVSMMSPPPSNSGIFTVPWFEKYVVEHWMLRSKPNYCRIS